MGKRRLAALAVACALTVSLSGCGLFGGGGGKSPSPSSSGGGGSSSPSLRPGALPPPVTTKVLVHNVPGQDTASTKNVLFSVYGVYRDGEYSTLLMSAQLDPADPDPNKDGFFLTSVMQRAHPAETAEDPSDPPSNADDLTLVDPSAKKAYLVARDARNGGKCLCPDDPAVLEHDKDVFTATFAAPPATSKKIDVSLPNVGYFMNVPVLDQKAPKVEETSGVVTEAPEASAGPMKAEVVDITGEVSNIDLSVVRSKDKVTLDANVLFAFDKATLTTKAKSRLAEAAGVLKKNARGQRVKVNGYTDSKGSNSYNQSLSQRRAEAVRKALQPLLGGTGITLVSKGYGEAAPVAPNAKAGGEDNPKGRALNRRVEIVYRK